MDMGGSHCSSSDGTVASKSLILLCQVQQHGAKQAYIVLGGMASQRLAHRHIAFVPARETYFFAPWLSRISGPRRCVQ